MNSRLTILQIKRSQEPTDRTKAGGDMSMKNSSTQEGFTLLEILVALTILSIGLLGMAGITTSIIHGNSLSNKVTTATTLGQDRMEHFRRLGYSTTPVCGTPPITEDYNSITNYPFYKRVSLITGVGTDDCTVAPDGMKTVKITVYWDLGAKSVELQTILAQ
jgi:type IV pilus assembly protein PilV